MAQRIAGRRSNKWKYFMWQMYSIFLIRVAIPGSFDNEWISTKQVLSNNYFLSCLCLYRFLSHSCGFIFMYRTIQSNSKCDRITRSWNRACHPKCGFCFLDNLDTVDLNELTIAEIVFLPWFRNRSVPGFMVKLFLETFWSSIEYWSNHNPIKAKKFRNLIRVPEFTLVKRNVPGKFSGIHQLSKDSLAFKLSFVDIAFLLTANLNTQLLCTLEYFSLNSLGLITARRPSGKTAQTRFCEFGSNRKFRCLG